MNLSLIISDANILIDLANLKLLDVFAQLNFNSCVTDFVLEELNEEQQVKVKELEKDGKIQILTSDSNDILEIAKLTAKSSGLSVHNPIIKMPNHFSHR
jgi:predicted nucleic acid-binding protein